MSRVETEIRFNRK